MRYTQSETIKIQDPATDMDKVYVLTDNYLGSVGITGKNALRIKLLTEEVLRLLRSVIGCEEISFCMEGDKRVARICVTAANHIDKDKQRELLSISSTGENANQSGFFGTLLSMFTFDDSEESEWSLKDYEDELRRRKADDPYSQEAWEDLERSLVANLADDIEVGISKGKIRMVVSKDLSESLSTVGSKAPVKTTGSAFINSDRDDEERFFEDADRIIGELEVSEKDSVRLRLLLEEVAGMLRAMTADFQAMFWFEKYSEECCLKITGKTTMDTFKKQNLINVSSDRKNNAVSGVMGKIGDVIENGLMDYSEVSRLSQKYGGAVVNYGALGIYGGLPDTMYPGVMWSLRDYKNALEPSGEDCDYPEAWDELEKSVVASLAKDVLVSVKKDRIDMTVIYALTD